ncbi:MAG: four helix bundle protein [bacterium]
MEKRKKIKTFQDLRVWQKSHKLALIIYKITTKLPKHEQYILINQIRRSAISIPANIAEGMGRNTKAELKNFLYNARGSLQETIYFLILIKDLNYIDSEEYEKISKRYLGSGKAINIFLKSLK